MSHKEYFRDVDSIQQDEFYATLTDSSWIQLGFVSRDIDESIEINIIQARALRDWLDKALPPTFKSTEEIFRHYDVPVICPHCGEDVDVELK